MRVPSPRIINVITRLNVGGPARYVTLLTKSLLDSGYDAFLVAGTVPPNEDDMSDLVGSMGINSVLISEMGRGVSFRDAQALWKLLRLFFEFRPDVIHTHTAKAGTIGRIAGAFYRWFTVSTLIGRPRRCLIIHTYHGHVLHSYFGPFRTKVFHLIEKTLACLATDRIVVLCQQQFHELLDSFRIGCKEQYSVVPIGIDTKQFCFRSEDRRAVRQTLKIDDKSILIGIIGRLTSIKNHRLLFEAIAIYRNEFEAATGRPVQVAVLGDGELRHDLEEQAHRLGLKEDVLFLGTRRDLDKIYSALDVIALTSLNEGTPLAVLEGMSAGRPIIATSVGGIKDLLGPILDDQYAYSCDLCERGVLVRSQDPRAFCEGLARLISEEASRKATTQRGRAFVATNHSKMHLKKMIDLYNKDLDQHGFSI